MQRIGMGGVYVRALVCRGAVGPARGAVDSRGSSQDTAAVWFTCPNTTCHGGLTMRRLSSIHLSPHLHMDGGVGRGR